MRFRTIGIKGVFYRGWIVMLYSHWWRHSPRRHQSFRIGNRIFRPYVVLKRFVIAKEQ